MTRHIERAPLRLLHVLASVGFFAWAAQAEAQTSPAGLVAAYGFNEGAGTSVVDASGNGNTGTITGATWTTGQYGNALQFSGNGQLVTVPDTPALHLTTGMTLEAWVNPSTVTSAWRDVVYKGDDNYYLEATSRRARRPAAGGTFAGDPLYGPARLTVATWTHLAVTYDGATLSLYVNGVTVASRVQTGTIQTSTNPLQIGGDSIYGQYFEGVIDEVRVYNRALSAAEIQTDMATPVGGAPAPDTESPTAPSGLTAVGGSGQIDLSWTASTDNVAVTGYRVERCEGTGCSSFAEVGTSTGPSYADPGLPAGTTFQYRVRAADAAGNVSGYSNVASATTAAPDTQAPSAPAGLAATGGSGEVNLSWTASTDDVGVTGYRVERCQGTGCSTFAEIGTSTGPSYVDTGLAAETSFSYQVRATDAAGNLSAYSNIAGATTLPQPSGLVAAYGFDEGTGTSAADASGNGNIGTVTGAAWTTGQYGQALQFSGSGQLVTVPDASSLDLTTGMTLEAWVNPSTVTAAWRDVIYKGDDSYYLEGTSANASRPGGGGTFSGSPLYGPAPLAANTWTHLAMTYDGATLSVYVNGVAVASRAQTGTIQTSTNPLQIGGDSLYGQYFEGVIDEVRVYNRALSAAEVQTDMATPVGGAPAPDTESPTAPGGLTAVGGSGQIDLSWTASTDNVGVTGYRVERCEGTGCNSFAEVATSTGPSYTDPGLPAGTTFQYRVRATDTAGNLSGYSNVASATTVAPDVEPPSAPGTLTASAVSGVQVDLSWGAATDNVGVTGYRVERCGGAGCSDFVKLATVAGTTYSDIGLTPDSDYSYVVRATDAAANLGPYSNVASVTTLSSNPQLVAAYSFDEGSGSTVADSSGHGNTGTVVNAGWTTAGKYGNALTFDGASARVTIADSASLHLVTAMTLEAWVRPTSVSSQWRDVIYKGNDNYYLEATSTLGGVPAVGVTVGTAGAATYGPSALQLNTWTHLAATYDGALLRLYMNGSQVSSGTLSGSLATSTYPLEIGGDSLFGQFFHGIIDDVRIYNVALTPTQIQADMSSPIGAAYPLVSLSASSIDFGNQDTGTTSGPQTVTLTNVGTASLTISSIGVSGSNSADFTENDNCSAVVAPGGSCVISATFTPAATGTRVATITIANNAPGSPQTIALTGVGIGFGVSPTVAVLTPGQVQQFAATGGSGAVTWSVDGVVGGSASSGTISSAGLYTSPVTAGTHTITVTTVDLSQSASALAYITTYAGMFTHHNDNARTGQNTLETVLTPTNVNPATFGRLLSYPLDGQATASPLYMADVTIPGIGVRNVVYVATQHDTVYAFDADGLSLNPLWQTSFINPGAGITPVPADDTGECCDIAPEIGITGTPVIDPTTGTLYVVAKTKEGSGGNATYVQRLHALDVSTGTEKLGGPVVLQASVPGTGSGSSNGTLTFNALRENQRPALLLSNGVVYIGFGSHGDNNPYHGWVLGYDATTLEQVVAHCVSPDSWGAGIWQANGGLAADGAGSIYYVTGNGPFSASTGGRDYGDSFVKISPTGVVLDYFTPWDEANISANNFDLGAAGPLLLPDQPGTHPHLLVSAGKNNTVYLIDRDNMGHHNPTDDSQIVQSLINIFPFGTPEPGNYSAPVYFNGKVYFGPIADNIQAFTLTNGLLSTTSTSRASEVYSYPGAAMAVSANGTSNGILWAVQRRGDCGVLNTCGTAAPGVLRAYDASDLGNELYNSDQAGTRDTLDYASKFSVPLVANGKVFVASMSRLTIYGLLPGQ